MKTARLGFKVMVAAVVALSILVVSGCGGQQGPAPTSAPSKAPATQPTKSSAPATAPTTAAPAPTKESASGVSSFPTKPIEMVVHTNPGDGADIFARKLADILQKEVGVKQPINVVNKVGGSGATMFGYMASKAGDPHFIMPFQVSTITTPLRNDTSGLNYKSFTPIALLANDEMVVAVRAESPFQNMKDIIDAAKKTPKSVSQAGGVFGGSDSIVGYLIEQATGVKFNFISFKGNGEAMVAILGGNADFFIGNPSEVIGQVEAKKARVLAVASPKRLEMLPDVPTLKEQGIDVEFQAFRGWAGPKSIPADGVNTISDWAKKIVETATFKAFLKENALTGNFMNSADFTKYMDGQQALYSKVLKEMGILK